MSANPLSAAKLVLFFLKGEKDAEYSETVQKSAMTRWLSECVGLADKRGRKKN